MYHILVDRLRIFSHVGCHSDEKLNGQYFYVSLDLEVKNENHIVDNIKDTICYASICEHVTSIVEVSKCDLIEYLADNIATSLLEKYIKINTISVIISKPHAPINATCSDISVTVTKKRMHRVSLSLGSNIGDKRTSLKHALVQFYADDSFSDISYSSVYQTSPMGYTEQEDFYNICVSFMTSLSPFELLKFTQNIEHVMCRDKRIINGPRNIDVDILTYDDIHIESPFLTLPHPRMHERSFVLAPLGELLGTAYSVDTGVIKIGAL